MRQEEGKYLALVRCRSQDSIPGSLAESLFVYSLFFFLTSEALLLRLYSSAVFVTLRSTRLLKSPEASGGFDPSDESSQHRKGSVVATALASLQ